MIKANFNTYASYVTDSLYQWDLNQVLSVTGLNLVVVPEVHFSNANMDRAIVRQATMVDHVVSVGIPNSLLQDPLTIRAHIGIYEGETFKVVELVEIPIVARKRPSDYQIEDADEEIYSFKALENAIANMVKVVDFNANNAKINARIDNMITRAEFDTNNTALHERIDDEIDTLTESVAERFHTVNDNINAANESIDTTNARIDNIIAHNDDTEGNTELVDIRVDADGTTHASAGAAVRSQATKTNNLLAAVTQGNLCPNPFQPLLFDQYKYYYGLSSGLDLDVMDKPRYTIGNFAEYLTSVVEEEGSSHGICARLLTPLPVFEDPNGEYVLIVKSGKSFPNTVQLHFSTGSSWNNAVCTMCTCNVNIAAGYNVIPLKGGTFYDNGHTEYTHICVNAASTALADADALEMYIVKSDALTNWITYQAHADNKYLAPDKSKFTTYGSNISPTFSINGAKISAEFPAETSDEAIWRYGLIGYNLGSDIEGKKILIRSNSLDITSVFGIGTSAYAWRKKGFNVNNGEIALIDVSSFIAENEELSAHTGNYYVTLGIDFGTKTSVNATTIEFEIMLVTDLDLIDPYDAWFAVDPNDFVRKDGDDYITCWGDSLTAQGGWTSVLAELSGLPVYNGGTGGESARVIVARQGADVMTVNNIVIPAGVESVTIAERATDGGIATEFGHTVMPLLQGGAHVNPVKIGDVEGTLAWTGSDYSDTSGTWTFTRSAEGEEITIDRPTAIRTDFDRNKNKPYLMVIFIGQNGGYDDLDELISQHRLMINHASASHVVILGLSSGTAESRADYETRMVREFGRYFISLRAYLSAYGLADAGLTATEEDTAAIEVGQVPPQLLSDSVHFTETTREIIGNMLYKKCCELGIF